MRHSVKYHGVELELDFEEETDMANKPFLALAAVYAEGSEENIIQLLANHVLKDLEEEACNVDQEPEYNPEDEDDF